MQGNANPFKKAEKAKAKLRLALSGPSGSGKTYSALSIAQPFGKIAVIDTEHGSASKYAGLFPEFDVLELSNYHPQNYINALSAAAAAGYDVLIIDSLSHAWNGAGGVLEIVDKAASRSDSKNTFAAWRDATPLQQKLVEAILAAPMHIIVTMRSKTEYVLELDKKGKMSPRKVGTAPIQRDGIEYEFDVVGEMNAEHDLVITKTRVPALNAEILPTPDANLGAILLNWLSVGVDAPPPPPKAADEPAPASVRGAGIPATPSKQENNDMRQRPDETEHDPNLYTIEKLIINRTETALQYVLAVHKRETRILLSDPGVLENITIDGAPVLGLEPKIYKLSPMWSVQADHTAAGWDVQSIDAGVPEREPVRGTA